MKTTYLIYKQIDGTRQLVRATQEEWDAILKANRKLPPEQRRRFEMDCIEESGEMDRMYIEVNEQDYRAWQTIRKRRYRNRKAGAMFEHLSLDAEVDSSEVSSLHECVASNEKADQPFLDKRLLPDLEKALSAWKPWANELLHLYMAGKRRSSTAWLANCCGVSERMARRYKKEFEIFIKNFLA